MLMCMCMLTKRAQVLFEENEWKKLTSFARKRNASVGSLVREATKIVYLGQESEKKILTKRRKAYEEILRIRPKPVKGKIDYKEMINYGRKY